VAVAGCLSALEAEIEATDARHFGNEVAGMGHGDPAA
jgi:hypothetical protein